ncbi:MAG: hypothetical protein ACRYGG_07680 [Janthinobacterium lividum]
MASAILSSTTNNPYPNTFKSMKPGDFAICLYGEKEIVVMKTINNFVQMLDRDNGWDTFPDKPCRLLNKGEVITITI